MEAQKSNILSSACASVSFGLAQDCTVMGTSKEWGYRFSCTKGSGPRFPVKSGIMKERGDPGANSIQ